MWQFRLDSDSPWDLKLPGAKRPREVIALARAFVAHDQTLPPDKRSPYGARVQSLLGQAESLTTQRTTGESQRTVSAETLKRAERDAQEIARQVQGILIAYFPKTPERAEEWGLNLKQGTHTIILPKSRSARLDFLNCYLAKEESRAPAERFPAPALDEVRRVRDTIAASLTGRASGQTQREGGVAATYTIARDLSNILAAALLYLLAEGFNFAISPDLQAWGFVVTEHTR